VKDNTPVPIKKLTPWEEYHILKGDLLALIEEKRIYWEEVQEMEGWLAELVEQMSSEEKEKLREDVIKLVKEILPKAKESLV